MKFHTTDPKLRQLLDTVNEHLHLYRHEQDLTIEVDWASSPGSLPHWKYVQGRLRIACRDAGEALMLIGRYLTQNDKTSETLEPRFSELAAMLLDDYPAVADYGVRLSDIAKESDDPYADYMLYQFVSYLTVEDSWYAMSDRFPGAACYHELPEEQLKQIQENEYLNAYIQAFAASTDNTVVDLGYYRWEDPEGERALELADALISMKEEAGFPHYIRGMVLNGVDRYEEAIREYTAALAQQPDEHYIWYALGACYEELGDLQNAQQAFQISLDIMPKIGSSHTGDWTGVSVHAGFALERVRGQLAQGGN